MSVLTLLCGLQAMLHIAAIMRLGSSGLLSQPADDDSLERMRACLRVLASRNEAMDGTWLAACRASFVNMIGDKQRREAAELKQLVRASCTEHCIGIPATHNSSPHSWADWLSPCRRADQGCTLQGLTKPCQLTLRPSSAATA